MLALLCSVVVNTVQSIFAEKGKKADPISPDLFIPKWGGGIDEETSPTSKEQSLEEQKNALLSIAQAFGAKKTRKVVGKSTERKSPPIGRGMKR